MASPQKENGYTAIANEILEKLAYAGINGSGYRILLVVIRKTYGFNKKKDIISLSQFQKATQMERKQAVETLKYLVGKRILVKEQNTYKFNKNWEEWVVGKRPPQWAIAPKGSGQLSPKSSGQKTTYKRKKENNTKDILAGTNPARKDQDIITFIEAFEDINPSIKAMFANKTERASARRMIDKYGLEKMLNTIKALPEIMAKEFAPQITTPYELERKLGKLLLFLKKPQKYAIG